MSTDVATACSDQQIVQPFLPWWDPNSYVFAPNGGLEIGGAGWRLGGASVVSGNEPWYVHGRGDQRSLALPAGGSAVSPAACIGLVYPFTRLFANGPSGGELRVDMLYVDNFGWPRASTLGVLSGKGGWRLSPRLVLTSPVVSLLSKLQWTSGTGQVYSAVAFRFTAVDGDWRLDDLYVDPFKFG